MALFNGGQSAESDYGSSECGHAPVITQIIVLALEKEKVRANELGYAI
jgi:hypothetical protein